MATKILLLEDDKLFNETLEDFLEEEGFDVTCALDPYTALELTYENSFDLYLFDVNLPYESGFDLLAKLRDSGDTTPSIFLTSRDDKESLRDGFMVGGDDYMRKPIDLDEMLFRIKAVIRRQAREEYISFGSFRLDILRKSLCNLNGVELSTTHKAVELLILLLEANGTVVST
ncbi:MAG TPA: response regulator transcription factor, partial [Sulfurovum sp.]|nr:response regulator transcription factor [Sulfurovum sp.]